MMKPKYTTLIRKYAPEGLVLLILVVLVGVRMTSSQHFRPGAEKRGEPALKHTNLIDESSIALLPKSPVRIYLDTVPPVKGRKGSSLLFTDDEITQSALLRKLRHMHAPVVLVSTTPSRAARAWMILAQLGVKDIYVLGDPQSVEHFPYFFQPDEQETGQ